MRGETSPRARLREAAMRQPFTPGEGAGVPHRILGTARPDEPEGNDRWAAMMSGFLVAVAGALLAWVLMTLAHG